MASRFVEADEDFIEELKHGNENKNAKRSTLYWTGVFKQWAVTRDKNEQIDSYQVSQLNETIAQLRCIVQINTFWVFLLFMVTI